MICNWSTSAGQNFCILWLKQLQLGQRILPSMAVEAFLFSFVSFVFGLVDGGACDTCDGWARHMGISSGWKNKQVEILPTSVISNRSLEVLQTMMIWCRVEFFQCSSCLWKRWPVATTLLCCIAWRMNSRSMNSDRSWGSFQACFVVRFQDDADQT